MIQTVGSGAAILLALLSGMGMLLVVQGCSPAPEPTADPESGPEVGAAPEPDRELIAGDALDRRLAPGQTHGYRLSADAGDFLDVVVDQRGVDLIVSLIDPSGETLLEADAPIGDLGPEEIRAVTSASGTHRLVLRAWDGSAPPGGYRLTVRAVRPAGEEDRGRAAAAQVFAEGEALSWEGRFPEAIERFRRADAMARPLSDTALRAEAHERICSAYWTLREVREAVAPCRASAALFRRAGDVRREGMALSFEGVARFSLGQVDAAIRLYDRALERATEAGDRKTVARVLSFRGQAHQARDEIQAALDDYGAALPELRRTRLDFDRARTLQNLGVLYRLLGRPGLARDRLEAARAAWIEIGDDRRLATTVNQLGELARGEGRAGDALALYGRALELRRAAGDRRGQAKTLEKLGLIRAELGEAAEARGHLREALALLEGVDDPRSRASLLLAVARLDESEGRPAAALDSFRRALDLYRGVGDTTEEAECLLGIARCQRSLGRLDDALAASGETLERIESVRLRSLRQDLRTSYFATVDDHFDLAVDLLTELDRERPGRGYAARALAVAERARARSLLDGLTEAGARLRHTAPPELLARERGLRESLETAERRRLHLAELAAAGDVPRATADDAERQVRELVAAIEATRARMRAASPRYAALERPQPLALAQIQAQLLDEGTRLLQYRLGRERSHLWMVSRDGIVHAELPPRSAVTAAARRAHDLLLRSHRRETRAGLARELCDLSRTVLGPVADRLGGSRLVVVPDGALAYVPFAALPRPAEEGCDASRPLLVDHEISYLPSASSLAALRARAAERPPPDGAVAVVADPPGSGLPFARREGEAILALAPADRSFGAFGSEASREQVAGGALGGYRIVHFATHGVLDARRPELSGLVLAERGEGGDTGSGTLRAHEVYDLELPAELVVLSACETALGSEVRGEGLVGLTQGFFHAGAERVMVSLWRVGDRSTGLLMERFYRELLISRRTPSAALREAQLAALRDERFAAPYHWAGFVLQGEWR